MVSTNARFRFYVVKLFFMMIARVMLKWERVSILCCEGIFMMIAIVMLNDWEIIGARVGVGELICGTCSSKHEDLWWLFPYGGSGEHRSLMYCLYIYLDILQTVALQNISFRCVDCISLLIYSNRWLSRAFYRDVVSNRVKRCHSSSFCQCLVAMDDDSHGC